jgi:hypothetical protein
MLRSSLAVVGVVPVAVAVQAVGDGELCAHLRDDVRGEEVVAYEGDAALVYLDSHHGAHARPVFVLVPEQDDPAVAVGVGLGAGGGTEIALEEFERDAAALVEGDGLDGAGEGAGPGVFLGPCKNPSNPLSSRGNHAAPRSPRQPHAQEAMP